MNKFTIKPATPYLRAFIATALIGSLASSFATICVAADGLPSQTVKYGDLDIAKPAGAATLYGRIVSAARNVCRADDNKSWDSGSRDRACVHDAVASAVTKVNQTSLFVVYNEHYKPSLPAPQVASAR